MTNRVPVTVLTGHLGAGKTTLLNRILSADDGRRYAVIVNEFGEIGIDGDLVVASDEELFELNNGCVCCAVRGDLVRALHGLLRRHGGFDAIVVETSGLADPGPVAQTFFIDRFLAERTALDSVTTVVDAKHILLRLADSAEAREQVAFADQIVLNKMGLVAPDALGAIEARLRAINGLAPIHRAERADVPLDKVLGQGGFDLDRIVALEPGFLAPDTPHDHEHAADIASVALVAAAPMDGARLRAWLTALVAARGQEILRAKGIFDVYGEDRMVFQSVHMLSEWASPRPWRQGEARTSRLVLIGRNLDVASLEAEFASCGSPPAS
jgi:G3E family GTPase